MTISLAVTTASYHSCKGSWPKRQAIDTKPSTDASAVMRDCKADLGALKAGLVSYLDNELKDIVTEKGGAARLTAAFERVAQRAASHAQGLGRPAVTGANTLLALFPETRSPAARLLGEQGLSEERAADFIAHSIGKGAS